MIRLLRCQARRDRRQILIWVVAITALIALAGNAVRAEFPSEADRTNIIRLALATPSLVALRGLPNGPGIGSLVFFQLFSWLAVMVGLMNTFLATRHGRADEEHGRRELVAAAAISRMAPLAATLTLGALLDSGVAVVALASFLLVGLGLPGALVGGLALGVTGFAFLGVGLLASQLTATSRSANTTAAGFVGLAYLLRAAGDALGTPDLAMLSLDSAWPSWLSPIGWGQQTFAFTDNRVWPLSLGLVLGSLTAAGALALQARRDLGSSLLPQRRGRAVASPALRSHLGLSWRLQWTAVLAWSLSGALLGLFTGTLARAVTDAKIVNPEMDKVLASMAPGGAVDVISLLISAIIGLTILLAAAAGIQGVLRLRSDETDGAAELVLATPLSRVSWLLNAVLIGTVSVLVVVSGVAVAGALSFLSGSDSEHAWIAFGQAFAGVPAALVFVGLTAGLVVVVPRLAIGLAWGLFAVAAVLGLLGGLLRLPDFVRDLSPFSHIPAVPVQGWTAEVVLLLITLVLAAVATIALHRRDLSP